MSNKTRKRLWPVSLVMAVAIVGVLAAFLAVAFSPTNTQAHDGASGSAHCDDLGTLGKIAHDEDPDNDHTCAEGPPPPTDPGGNGNGMPSGATIESSSTSASSTIELKLTIPNLSADDAAKLTGGGSIELYLEDEFNVDDEDDGIDRDTVYFTASGGSNAAARSTSNGRRVYATDPVEIDTDGHFTADKSDWAIQVLIPDMNTTDDYDGFDGPKEGQTLVLTFTKSSGIRNDSEAGTHSVGYSILGPNDGANDGPQMSTYKAFAKGDDAMAAQVKTTEVMIGVHNSVSENAADVGLKTLAKIGLSDVDNDRGYELTVTGSGFNNGTSAAAYVLADSDTTADLKAMVAAGGAEEAAACSLIIRDGHRAGIATVGSDDKVAITFEVTVPVFRPGNQNYICMVDGEGRSSNTDVEDFNLFDSLRVVPSSANAGDVINVFAQDFPVNAGGLTELKIANQVVWTPTMSSSDPNYVSTKRDGINDDGSGTITFELPGSLNGVALEGTVRIDVNYGGTKEDGKITVTGSALRLSQGEVRANESITIQGEGFGDQTEIDPDDITMDGVALHVDRDSLEDGMVPVSNAGQFVATVAIWSAADEGANPSLIAGTHTIRVKDSGGFFGTASIVVKEPTIMTLPLVAGPRDVITITGENWPVDNPDGGNAESVEITVDDDPNRASPRKYTAIPDLTGRFTFEHRVSRDVGIPSNNQIKVAYGENSEIVKISSFDVPESIIEVSPAEAQPGETISLSVSGMPVYTNVYSVEVGGRNVLGGQNFSTDRTGAVTSEVTVPGLDPGVYSVIMQVGEEEHRVIAIGEVEVLSEGAIGTEVTAAEGLANLGDNLVAVFHFNNAAKEWSFYDPRPEFADLNTLENMVQGEAYWILISEDVEEVVLNNKVRSLTCRGDDCWNLEVW